MDIITHTLSGVAIGTAVAGFSTKGFRENYGVITIGGIGGALPDFDAISLWSKFDATLGCFFKLSKPGNEIYFSKFWYSHHGFLHSIFASFFLAFLGGLLWFLITRSVTRKNLLQSYKVNKFFLISFILGFTLHLLEDMPTPTCVWGGVNFFWPSKSYLGGTGEIWWWNNYDIFLIVCGVIFVNILILLILKKLKLKLGKLTTIVFLFGFVFALVQIKSRPYDFNYVGHTPDYSGFELKSKKVQKTILGEKIYQLMVKLDNHIPLNF